MNSATDGGAGLGETGMRCERRWKALWVVSAMATASPLFAQAAPPAAPRVTPPTREEVERPGLRPPEQGRARLSVEGGIERAPCPLADAAYQNITFTMREAQFNNLRGADPASLRDSYAEFIGKTVPLATVCEIRDRAATILRSQGYLAAVQVPPQEIQNDIVKFDVLMAKVVSVQVRGKAGRSEQTLAGFLQHLTEMPVFNEQEAERYLLLVRDIPGYDVRLTLRPAGTAPGEVIGEVAVVYTPVEADFNLQDYGSRAVGRWGALGRVQFNGLTGLGDRTSIGLFSTLDFDEQQVLQLFHDFAVGSEGLRLAGSFSYAWTRPSGTGGLDTKSRTLIANVEANYPFLRSLATSVYGAAGLDFVDQEVDLNHVTVNRDHLRVLYARATFDTIDTASVRGLDGYSLGAPRWHANGSLEFRQGVDILNATEPCPLCVAQPSRVPADTTGTVIRATAALEYRPAPELALWVSPRFQYAPDPVLAFEEISGGNYTVGRGYDPGIITGYKGAGVQAEIRFGRTQPESFTSFAFQPYVFFDAERVWFDRGAGDISDDLQSVGGGVRAAYGDRVRLDATLAAPLKRTDLQTRKGGVRFLISLTTRLWPWGQ